MGTRTTFRPSPLSGSLWNALHQLEACQEEGRWERADAIAAWLLARWPETAAVLVEVARLHARQGRYDEAMELLHRAPVGENVRLLNYPLCAPPRAVRPERESA